MPRPCRLIPVDRLRSLLSYNGETGDFTWRVRKSARAQPGAAAGFDNRRGYWTICFDGTTYMAHRLAWAYVHGECPKQICHINGDPFDNRIANLRRGGWDADLLSVDELTQCPAHGTAKMSSREFKVRLAALGWGVTEAARFLKVNLRTAQRWSAGETHVPHAVALLLRVAVHFGLQPRDMEQLASPTAAAGPGRQPINKGLLTEPAGTYSRGQTSLKVEI